MILRTIPILRGADENERHRRIKGRNRSRRPIWSSRIGPHWDQERVLAVGSIGLSVLRTETNGRWSVEWPVITLARAGAAERAAVANDFALEVDAFAALGADYAGAFEAGKVLKLDFDFDPLFGKQRVVGKLCVSLLLPCFFLQFGKHFLRGLFGRFLRGDAHGAARLQIAEGGGDLAPIAEFQGALAEAAICHKSDSIRDATIDFHVGDDALALRNRIF